jgi:hypothetical protein
VAKVKSFCEKTKGEKTCDTIPLTNTLPLSTNWAILYVHYSLHNENLGKPVLVISEAKNTILFELKKRQSRQPHFLSLQITPLWLERALI